jgi:SAM-dependent methyltransferase
MKRCLICNGVYDNDLSVCTHCGFRPNLINGFEAYASSLAKEGSGFQSSYFSDLTSFEEDSFWFIARNKLIIWAISKYFSSFQSFLEVGCGTGFVLSGVSKNFPGRRLYGSEILVRGLDIASKRLPFIKLFQMDARNIPFEDEFDLIGAFDLLEHVKEDSIVLLNFFKAVKPGGGLILSVPQHQWLWSITDKYAHHERRYSAEDIHTKLNIAGFEVIRSTSFVSLLIPIMVISRKLRKSNGNFDACSEFRINPILNKMLELIMLIEGFIIKLGINFPIGGSRLILARKPR